MPSSNTIDLGGVAPICTRITEELVKKVRVITRKYLERWGDHTGTKTERYQRYWTDGYTIPFGEHVHHTPYSPLICEHFVWHHVPNQVTGEYDLEVIQWVELPNMGEDVRRSDGCRWYHIVIALILYRQCLSWDLFWFSYYQSHKVSCTSPFRELHSSRALNIEWGCMFCQRFVVVVENSVWTWMWETQ